MAPKYVPVDLTFDTYDYKVCIRKEDIKPVDTTLMVEKQNLLIYHLCHH